MSHDRKCMDVNLPCLSGASKSEEADDYCDVVLVLNHDWRIIVCRHGIQWILQRRAGVRHGKARWDGKCYCRTRDGLASRVRELVGVEAVNALAPLPTRIEGGRGLMSPGRASFIRRFNSGRLSVAPLSFSK